MILLALATFFKVFLLAFQQQNITHDYKYWAVATSYGIAIADVVVVLGTVNYGLAAIPYIGTGGAVGVILAMITHKRIRR